MSSHARSVVSFLCLLLLVGCSKSENEAHYQALEQNRNQQQQEAQPQAANPSASPAASASPANPQASPNPNTTNIVAAHASGNYWTSFRGPNRDGRYDERPVLTNWPSQGLPLVWKEPVGVGYASF